MPTGLPTLYPSIRTYEHNMQQPAQDHEPSIAMSLREHLLAAGAGQPAPQPQMPQHPMPGSPQHAIDPAISGTPYTLASGDNGDGHLSEGRKGRRELSTSKRAAQNRAAQRAFRQRKEEYIKQLKDQVKDYEILCESYKSVQNENYQLREYIISLQSRLLEIQGEIPQPPAGVDLSRQHHAEPHIPVAQPQQPTEPHQESPDQNNHNNSNGGLSQRQIGELQMAAQAAAAAQHGGGYDAKPQKAEDSTASGGPVAPTSG